MDLISKIALLALVNPLDSLVPGILSDLNLLRMTLMQTELTGCYVTMKFERSARPVA